MDIMSNQMQRCWLAAGLRGLAGTISSSCALGLRHYRVHGPPAMLDILGVDCSALGLGICNGWRRLTPSALRPTNPLPMTYLRGRLSLHSELQGTLTATFRPRCIVQVLLIFAASSRYIVPVCGHTCEPISAPQPYKTLHLVYCEVLQ